MLRSEALARGRGRSGRAIPLTTLAGFRLCTEGRGASAGRASTEFPRAPRLSGVPDWRPRLQRGRGTHARLGLGLPLQEAPPAALPQ